MLVEDIIVWPKDHFIRGRVRSIQTHGLMIDIADSGTYLNAGLVTSNHSPRQVARRQRIRSQVGLIDQLSQALSCYMSM